MKRAIAAVVLSGLAACPPPAHMSKPEGCSNGVDANGYCVDIARAVRPPAARTETVVTEKAIDGFDIAAAPAGAAGWSLRIVNRTDAVGSILWSESTFVGSDGRSFGRLIAGRQESAPIAPGATVTQSVMAEGLARQEGIEAEVAGRRLEPKLLDALETTRAARTKAIVGGRLYVTVVGAAGKQTWSGVVRAGGE